MSKVKQVLQSFGAARLIIVIFLVVLLVTAAIQGQDMPTLLSDSIVRIGMNLPLSLAMIPAMNSGIGMNMGLPIGILAGLIGGILSIELGCTGWAGFAVALLLGAMVGVLIGILYGKLLNTVRGSEMLIGNYLAMCAIYLLCMFWYVAPFTNPVIIWPMGGNGVRNTVAMTGIYEKILDQFLAFDVGGVTIPTGLIIFNVILCIFINVFIQTKTGRALTAAGDNADFAHGAGIHVDWLKILGAMISTVIAAIGIIAYSQSFGFYQAYDAPLKMAFAPMAGVLLGGATIRHATVWNAILGTVIFQTMITVALPVANILMPGVDISEVIRIIICNGIILYALAQTGGNKQ